MTLVDTWIPMAPPLRIDTGGAVRIGKSRITLYVLLSEYKQGSSAEQIVANFDTLDLADVYAVISYYLKNREIVDAYLAEVERKGEEIRREIESAPGYMEWRNRMAEKLRRYKDEHP